jgi:TctA family transporter
MIKEEIYIGKRIDRILELPRLAQEGATLKNVSDNMRALTACIAMFIAIGLVYKSPFVAAKVIAFLWGCWTFLFAALACLQAGLLFGTVLQDLDPRDYLYRRFKNARDWIIYLVSILAFIFVYGAVFIIHFSLEHMLIK